MSKPKQPNTYQAERLWHVRAWLTYYARPSAIEELYETFWEYDNHNTPDGLMLKGIYQSLTGIDLSQRMEEKYPAIEESPPSLIITP